VFGRVAESVESAEFELPDDVRSAAVAGAGAAGVASGPALAAACLGFWAYNTRRQDDDTREAVQAEFRSILGLELLELPAAEREDIKEEHGLEPGTLKHLNRAASGVTWRRLDQTVQELEETTGRVDELEKTVAEHGEVVDSIVRWIRTERRGPKKFQTLREFEDDEVYGEADYVTPSYRLETGETDPFGGTEPSEPERGEDALDWMLGRLDRDHSSITVVTGESGIGKTRLLVEAGRQLQQDDDTTVYYLREPAERVEQPAFTERTVLFLDEVGQTGDAEWYLRLASPNRRREEGILHVVAAVRPVYHEQRRTFTDLPESVTNRELTLELPDEELTIQPHKEFDVGENTAQTVYEATEGHPELSQLLVLAGQGRDDVSVSPEGGIEALVERTMLQQDGSRQRECRAGGVTAGGCRRPLRVQPQWGLPLLCPDC